MTTIARQDGTHRSTPASTAGHILEQHEARLRRHLVDHAPKALEELCTTEIRHCSGCGSTDDDSLTTGHSYSACCNEPVVSEPCDLSHAR